MTIRVMLVDDQPVVRAGFRSLLELSDDIVVVAEAADGAEALVQARACRPDVVLMDVRMPVIDGVGATRAITSDPVLAHTRVLVLTTFEIEDHVLDALEAGASGFLLKSVKPDELRTAIRVVADGQAMLSPVVTRYVVDELERRRGGGAIEPDRLDVLTDREREVVRLVALGLSTEEVGQRLVMSPLTAKSHLTRAVSKLGARDRAHLVVIAYETRLVSPSEAP